MIVEIHCNSVFTATPSVRACSSYQVLFIYTFIYIYIHVFLIYLTACRIAIIDEKQMVNCVQKDTNKCKITYLNKRSKTSDRGTSIKEAKVRIGL